MKAGQGHIENGVPIPQRVSVTLGDTFISVVTACIVTVCVTAIAFSLIVPLVNFGKVSFGDAQFGLYLAITWGLIASVPISVITLFCPSKFRVFVAFEFAIMWAVIASVFLSQILHAMVNAHDGKGAVAVYEAVVEDDERHLRER